MQYNTSDRNPGAGPDVAFVMVAQQPVDEAGDRIEGRYGGVPMRGVAGARQDRHLDRAEAFLFSRIDLLERAVLIQGALQNQDRHADVAERLGNVPVLEVRIEPGLDPGTERAVHVGMPP